MIFLITIMVVRTSLHGQALDIKVAKHNSPKLRELHLISH